MTKTINFKNIIKKTVTVFLSAALALSVPMQALAAANDPAAVMTGVLPVGAKIFTQSGEGGTTYYISDIKTATEDSYEKAYNKLTNAGYVVVTQNTNEGSEKGRCCLIGYKLTTDSSKAITALNVMEMAGGYEFIDYQQFLKERTPGLSEMVDQFMEACRTLKLYVDGGNPNAVYAYNTLNLLCVPDTAEGRTGTPLGEYIISPSRTQKEIETLLLISTTDVISFMNNLIATGCADTYDNENGEEEEGWVADPDFIERTVYNALEIYDALSASDIKAMRRERKDEANLFRANLKALGEVEVRYLDEIIIEFEFTYDKGIDRPLIRTAYDFLTFNDAALTACFTDCLPESVPADDFVRIFTEYLKYETLPAKLAPLPEVVSPWMRDTVKMINEETRDPYNGEQALAIIERYNGTMADIELVASEIQFFIEQYRRQKPVFDALLEEMPDATMDEVLAEYTRRLEAGKYEEESEEAAMSDLIYFTGAYTLLSKYKLSPRPNLVMPDGTPCENLGEYFELIADAPDATTMNALVCAVTSSLSRAYLYNIKTAGLPTMILDGGVSPSNKELFDCQYEDNRSNIQGSYAAAGYGANECTIWYGTNRDLLDNEKLAYTDEAARLDAGNNDLLESYNSVYAQTEAAKNISSAMTISGIAMGAAGVLWAGGTFALALMGQMTAISITGLFKLGIGCMVGSQVAAGLGAGVMAAAICGVVGMLATAIIMVAFIVLLVLSLTSAKIKDEDVAEYTDIPTVLLDCAEDENNELTRLTRYDVVYDLSTSKPSDLNDMDKTGATRWIALYYSYEASAGSPLIAYNGNYFATSVDSMAIPEKALPLSKFGYTTPYSLNSYNKSSEKTVYMFYYTEHSVSGVLDRHTPGKYISDLKMAIAYTENMAKGSLLAMKNYSVFDVNLTPDSDFFTYIGYTTTNDPTKAVTDIRVKYASTEHKVHWGSADNEYISLFDEQHTTCPLKTVIPQDGNDKLIYVTTFKYQIYFSRSEAVGDPILASSLRVVPSLTSSLGNLTGNLDNYEYVRWFSGGAFDFMTDISDSNEVREDTHKFLVYTTEEAQKRTSDNGKLYLAGLAFFTGSDYFVRHSDYTGWQTLDGYASALGYKLIKHDISGGVYDAKASDYIGRMYGLWEMDDPLYIAYSVTKDPKKAITDIGLFTGEPKGDGNLLGNITRGNVSFEAAQIFREEFFAWPSYDGVKRSLFTSNAYITKISDEATLFDNDMWEDITEEMSDKTGRDIELTVKPRGLYLAGPQRGVAPIALSDVMYSFTCGAVPSSRGMPRGIYSLETGEMQTRISGEGWKTVHALDDYLYDEYDADGNLIYSGTNIGISRDELSGLDGIMYIYYRNTSVDKETGKVVYGNIPTRGTYIASAEISGSVEKDSAYDMARYNAMIFGTEIINAEDPLYTEAGERYDIRDESIIYDKTDKSITSYADKCYYISVSYQESSVGAVASLIMGYQDGKTAEPDSIKAVYRKTSRVSDKELSATYDKGHSFAPTKREKKDEDGNVIKSEYPEGYVLYSATHTGAAARILVLENLKTNDTSVTGMGRRFAEDTKGEIYSTDGNMKQAIALYSYSEPYIYDVAVVKGGTAEKAELLLGQMGFMQVIHADLLGSMSMEPVYIGIMRTKVPAEALQDIKIVYEKTKEKITENGLSYRRVNEEDLTLSSTTAGRGYDPVYIYVSTGSSRSTKVWGERTALTNLGLCIETGNGKVHNYYWNGMTDVNEQPASFKDTTEPLDVANVDYKHTDDQYIEDYYGYLNAELYEDELLERKGSGGTAAVRDYQKNHGYMWLVFTTNSSICYNDYARYLKNNWVTGTAAGDEALGIGSVIAGKPAVAAAIAVGIGAMVAGTMLIFIKKRKKSNGK